jgi:transcriptional regulator with XRE-family HTH domain
MVAERVANARRVAGMTKLVLAERVGLSKQGWQPYETGRRRFDVELLFRVAAAVGQPVTYLLNVDSGLTDEEEEVIKCYRLAPAAVRRAVLVALMDAPRERI